MTEPITCPICPRGCLLNEGQTGACGARMARNGRSEPVNHGLLSAIHVDPIEKKPLNHYLPGANVLSLGSFGCNLMCRGCQNDSISRLPVCRAKWVKLLPEQIVEEARRTQSPVIAYTYNEPIVWAEFVEETALVARQRGLKNVVVTAGYVTLKTCEKLFENIDAANVDLKGFSEEFYRTWSNGSLQPVLDVLEYLHQKPGFWLEITTLIVPGVNDSPQMLEAEFAWISEHLGCDVPVHLSAFHPAHWALDIPRTPVETILMAQKLAQRAGLHFVYPGNVPIPSYTLCPQCSHPVIQRMGFCTEMSGLNNGCCAKCGSPIPGVWHG